jgi:hypothetical protein
LDSSGHRACSLLYIQGWSRLVKLCSETHSKSIHLKGRTELKQIGSELHEIYVFQESFTCTRPEDAVACEESPQYYSLNEGFGRTDRPIEPSPSPAAGETTLQ